MPVEASNNTKLRNNIKVDNNKNACRGTDNTKFRNNIKVDKNKNACRGTDSTKADNNKIILQPKSN